MSDTPAHPVREHLAIVASTLDLAESDITDLRRVLEVAASTVEQAQSETTRAHFTSDRRTARTSLHSAAEMLAASRSASERGISLTIDIEERLISTRQHLHSARTRAVALTATGSLEPIRQQAMVASIEEQSRLVDLAAPLAQRARAHLLSVMEATGKLTTADPDDSRHHQVTYQLDQGIKAATRALTRAQESAAHLDRTIEVNRYAAHRSIDRAAAALPEAYSSESISRVVNGPAR